MVIAFKIPRIRSFNIYNYFRCLKIAAFFAKIYSRDNSSIYRVYYFRVTIILSKWEIPGPEDNNHHVNFSELRGYHLWSKFYILINQTFTDTWVYFIILKLLVDWFHRKIIHRFIYNFIHNKRVKFDNFNFLRYLAGKRNNFS